MMSIFQEDFPHRQPSAAEVLKVGVAVSGIGLGTVDYRSDTVALDDRAAELFDLPSGIALPRNDLHARIHRSDMVHVNSALACLFDPEQQGFVDVQHRVVRQDDSVVWLQARKQIWFSQASDTGELIPEKGIFAVLDITSHKEAEQRVQYLMEEMNHRAKNAMAVIQGMIRLSANSEEDEAFANRFSDRIRGLSFNHDALVKNNWEYVGLTELIDFHMSAFSGGISSRVTIKGPQIQLRSSAAQALGMAFHELATNAVKYGALSNDNGRIEIKWQISDKETFEISWQEIDGPPVVQPTQIGFGQKVLQDMAAANVDGKVTLEYDRAGLSWTLQAPISTIKS